MADSKKAPIRYLTIDRCLQSRTKRYGTKELKEACEKALSDDLGEEIEISLRQIQIDLQYMQRENGYAAPIEEYTDPLERRKKFYRYADPNYSIRKQPLKPDDQEALNEALLSLMTFEGRPEVEWIHELIGRIQSVSTEQIQGPAIVYDDNPDSVGLIHIQPLFQAIRKKKALKISYQPFNQPQIYHLISPYLLKEYNNRWYILCKSNLVEYLTCLALDRILQIEESTDHDYIPYPNNEDPKDFFYDFIGVTWEKSQKEKIRLHVKKTRVAYVLTKPIHPTQRHKSLVDNLEWDEITLQLIPNKEFYSQMLFFGDDLKIIEPISVREKIKLIVENMHQQYS